MALPPLFKYLDVRGATLTLGNGTFKHAKPSDFNDIEDLTIQSIFPEETEVALKKLSNGIVDVILQNISNQPTCNSPLREKVALIQHVFRTSPNAIEVVKAELGKEGREPIFDVEYMRERSKAFIKEINEFMQNYRILCVSTLNDSDKMWFNYADNHRGIVLRIVQNVEKDSKFQLFRQVEYCVTRPPLYDDTLNFIADSLFGDHEARRRAILDKIIYTKTLPWKHESEYRLAIPLRIGEPPWNVLPFHAEEITELYLGLWITEDDKDEIVSKARARNPDIAIFQMCRDANAKLAFDRI